MDLLRTGRNIKMIQIEWAKTGW